MKSTFMKVLDDTAIRGPQAWGVAWVDTKGRLRCYKSPGDVRKVRNTAWELVKNAQAFIFHTRWATHGVLDNLNNHPHSVDGGWLIHNGVVGNYRELAQATPGIGLISDCDSEIICRLAEQASGRLPDRMAAAIDQTTGNCAVAALWHKPETLVIAKRGNPLSVGRLDDGLWFSSTGVGIETAEPMKQNQLIEYRYKAGLPMVYRKRTLAEGRTARYGSGARFDPSGRVMSGTDFNRTQTSWQKKPEYRTTVIRPNRRTDDDDLINGMTLDEWVAQEERRAMEQEQAADLVYEPVEIEQESELF